MAVAVGVIVGSIWFVVNTTILLSLGVYVFRKHSKSKNFFQDFVRQRRIFSSLIILFLDQATDLGVLIGWYSLMRDETTDSIDYESVNLISFFYPLLGFFILYQIIMMFTACDSAALYDIILVIFQIYPYKTAYISLMESYKIMEKNEGIKGNMENELQSVAQKEDEEKADEAQVDIPASWEKRIDDDGKLYYVDKETAEWYRMSSEHESHHRIDTNEKLEIITQISKKEYEEQKNKELNDISEVDLSKEAPSGEKEEIFPTTEQDRMLLIQCILESMPGLVLQSVFWVRSFNDAILRDENPFIVFSIIASVISVAWRYVAIVDFECVTEKAKDRCYNLWYVVRICYRMASIIASFIVFVMIWVVIGGFWVSLWLILVFVGWNLAAVVNGQLICTAYSIGSGIKNMIGLTMLYSWKYHVIKFLENISGMFLVFFFLWTSFDCGVCVSGETREAYKGTNTRIIFLFAFGWCCSVGQFILYLCMFMECHWLGP